MRAPSVIAAAFLATLAVGFVASAAPTPAKQQVAPLPVDEVIVNAAAIEDSLPRPIKSYSVRWPHTATVRFTIDKVGRTRDIGFEPPDTPPDVQDALRATVERWRFWPALGACRHVEQVARSTVTFDEERVSSEGVVYEQPAKRGTQRADGFAWLDPADAGDRRGRPFSGPAGVVEPVALKQVPPRYPAAASRAARAGYAFVLVDVGADGRPLKVAVSDAWSPDPKLAPLFGREAVNAVKQWRFRAATVAGAAQPRQACQRFMFNMKLGAGG